MKYQDTIYYSDELNDDFGQNIEIKPFPKNFKYVKKNPLYIVWAHFIYWVVRVIAIFYNKIVYHQKIVNKKAFKSVKGGYFVYLNHTAYCLDAFTPNILNFKNKNYVLVGQETGSLWYIRRLLRSLGAIFVPQDMSRMREYLDAINYRSKRDSIALFPELHIWPYYTGIRNFRYNTFKLPVKEDKPIFTATNCYQKKRFSKRPKVVTYVDGPFYPNKELNNIDSAKNLRDKAYNVMKDRTNKYSTYNYFNYVQKEKSTN